MAFVKAFFFLSNIKCARVRESNKVCSALSQAMVHKAQQAMKFSVPNFFFLFPLTQSQVTKITQFTSHWLFKDIFSRLT